MDREQVLPGVLDDVARGRVPGGREADDQSDETVQRRSCKTQAEFQFRWASGSREEGGAKDESAQHDKVDVRPIGGFASNLDLVRRVVDEHGPRCKQALSELTPVFRRCDKGFSACPSGHQQRELTVGVLAIETVAID